MTGLSRAFLLLEGRGNWVDKVYLCGREQSGKLPQAQSYWADSFCIFHTVPLHRSMQDREDLTVILLCQVSHHQHDVL